MRPIPQHTRLQMKDRTMKRETLLSVLLVLMIGALAIWALVFTGVAQAGCWGSPLTHNWQCSCNPGWHWDRVPASCEPNLDNRQFYPAPGAPFVPPHPYLPGGCELPA
jgi:hypothetical protein